MLHTSSMRWLARLKHLLIAEDGSVSVLTALMIVPLLGFLGLGIDVGALRLAKQQLQAAADAGALAGTLELSNCGGTADCANLTTAAQDALSENGLTGSTLLKNCTPSSLHTLTIEVNNGPCALGSADPNNANTKVVEVVVSEWQPTSFARVLGFNSVALQVRAEATRGGTEYCILTLGTNGTGLQVNHSTPLTVQSCGVYVDSTDNGHALEVNGSLTAKSISVVGGLNDSGTVSPAPVTGAPVVADPLASLAAPAYSTGSCLQNPNYNAGTSFGPLAPGGTICYNGLNMNGSGTYTMAPGTYIINNGSFNFNGSGTLTGNGVTIYVAPGANFQLNGQGASSQVSLIAPTSGTYNGMLIYQAQSNGNTINITYSNAGTTLEGIIYGAAAELHLQGSVVPTLYTTIVVNSLNFDEGATIDDYALINPNTPLASRALLSQ